MDEHKCTICSSEIKGHYCSNCGQKFGDKPTNLIRLVLDFVEQVISIQKSDFATMLHVVKRPKFIVENYYGGNTGYYSSPGKVMLFAILVLIVHITFISNLILGIDFSAEALNLEYTFLFLFVVIFSIVSQIAFIRKGFLLSKYIIATTYVVSTFITFFTFLYWIELLVFDQSTVYTFIGFMFAIIIWLSITFTQKRKFLYYTLNALFILVLFLSLVIILSYDFSINTMN